MENYEKIRKALDDVGIPYINLISKDLSDDTFSGEYIDPKNPERNFTFENARIISPNIHYHKPISINIEGKLL